MLLLAASEIVNEHKYFQVFQEKDGREMCFLIHSCTARPLSALKLGI